MAADLASPTKKSKPRREKQDKAANASDDNSGGSEGEEEDEEEDATNDDAAEQEAETPKSKKKVKKTVHDEVKFARPEDGYARLWGRCSSVTAVLDTNTNGGSLSFEVDGRALKLVVTDVFALLKADELFPALSVFPIPDQDALNATASLAEGGQTTVAEEKSDADEEGKKEGEEEANGGDAEKEDEDESDEDDVSDDEGEDAVPSPSSTAHTKLETLNLNPEP